MVAHHDKHDKEMPKEQPAMIKRREFKRSNTWSKPHRSAIQSQPQDDAVFQNVDNSLSYISFDDSLKRDSLYQKTGRNKSVPNFIVHDDESGIYSCVQNNNMTKSKCQNSRVAVIHDKHGYTKVNKRTPKSSLPRSLDPTLIDNDLVQHPAAYLKTVAMRKQAPRKSRDSKGNNINSRGTRLSDKIRPPSIQFVVDKFVTKSKYIPRENDYDEIRF